MRKVFLYISLIILVVFAIPFVFTREFYPSKEISNIEEQIEKVPYDYKQYRSIGVLDANTGNVNTVELDDYICGVVAAEMPANYELEALKAQAVVARTYTLYNIINSKDKHGDGVICTSPSCCQAWISKEDRFNKWPEDERESNWKKIEEAVFSTQGKIIEYNGEVIDAFFHSNSGGKTEIPANVWGGSNYPYLKVVETSGEDGYSQFRSEVQITKKELESKMKERYKDFSVDWNDNPIKINEYTESGRVRSLKIGNKNISGVEARSIFGLKSANFSFEINNDVVKFSVIGYGHGVGLSQNGANSMAVNGAKYQDIILHFYADVEIVDI